MKKYRVVKKENEVLETYYVIQRQIVAGVWKDYCCIEDESRLLDAVRITRILNGCELLSDAALEENIVMKLIEGCRETAMELDSIIASEFIIGEEKKKAIKELSNGLAGLTELL